MAESSRASESKQAVVAPPVAAVDAPSSILTIKSPGPFTPPVAPETPPGGKFAVKTTEYENGRPVEKVRYVNAHGRPFSDDPAENMKDK